MDKIIRRSKKQAQMIQSKFEQYSQSTHDLAKFKREVLSEITVYDSLWRYYSKPSDKREADRDFCEGLLKKVASHDQMCARQLRQELDVKDRPMSMETMLNRLEDNQKLIESLDIESPAKNTAGAAIFNGEKETVTPKSGYTTTTKVFSLWTGT